MALIKMGVVSSDVRGTLGGVVYSRNRGGAYIRAKVSPVQPITGFNGASRAIFGAISKLWSASLTDTQRAGWEAFASVHPFVNIFGDAITLGGIAFFQAANRRVMQVGDDPILDAPANWLVPDPGAVTVAMAGNGTHLDLTTVTVSRTLTYDEGLYIFGTPPMLGARAPQKNDFRLINTQEGGLLASGVDFGAAYEARFAPLSWALGAKAFLRVAILNSVTGAISTSVLREAIVVGS